MVLPQYFANFSVELTKHFNQAIAMCGVRYHHNIEKRDTSTYYFEPSFVVIDTGPGTQSSDHVNDCHSSNVNDAEVSVISIVLGTFGILNQIVSLLAIVGFLFLKLRRVTAASTDIRSHQ